MNMKNDRPNNRGIHSTRIALTAAALALMAGAPAGLAQSSVDAEDNSGGIGTFMSFLSGGGQGNGAQPAAGQPGETDEFRTDGLYYDENMTVELHVQDEELTNVLQMLSLQSERNIVASNDVSARVTANLYGVTFHEALDAILHVNGYGYIEKGNFIYVYPANVLEEIEQASRQVEGRVFNLNFISAVDAADFVTPLLSDAGEIKSNGKVANWSDPSGPTGNEEFASLSTLIVYDYSENIEAVERMLTTLDTRPAQILVEATIVQTTLNEANAFGVDFSIIADFDYADFANPLGAVDALLDGNDGSARVPADGGATGIVGTPGNTSGPGTFKAGIVSNDVTVFLKLLNEITSTTIISNPKVVTLNRQPGRVLVGRKVGFLQTTSTDTSTTQSVEFLDTGTQLNFRPFVTGEGIIRMELKPQVSEAALRSTTDVVGSTVTIPDEITNELVANVMVPDGHTIVLGGLFREATTTSRRQVPVLGDIPILGSAFRGHDDDIDRQEIIFMITPSIVSDQVLVDQGLRGEEAVERVRAGAREGTLPFSQTRQAAQLIVEAEHLAAEGKTDAALHCVRRALHLVPNNEDAIALREQLVNERDIWPNHSVLNSIIEGDAEETRHNILQHGWLGDISQKEVEAEPEQTYASSGNQSRNQNRNGNQRQNQNRAQNRSGNAYTQPQQTRSWTQQSTTNQRNDFGDSPAFVAATDTGTWWTSPEFDVFMIYWAVAKAVEENREFEPSDRWWVLPQFFAVAEAFENGQPIGDTSEWVNTPEFDAFMTAWAQGLAQENGESWDYSDRWWNSEQFQSYATAVGTPAGVVSDNDWWASAEFKEFLRVWSTEAALEQGRTAPDVNDWYTDSDFLAFMQGFESAVNQAHASGEFGSQNGTSGSTYTQVPTDIDK
jgi:type IV pilus secretin PilQ/predicted competence protein